MRAHSNFYTKLLLLLLPLFLTVSLAWPAASPKSKDQKPEWERLVNEAYAMSRNFTPEERVDLLLDILQTPAGAAPDKGKRFSVEMFSICTRQLTLSHYRAAMQKNALVALSKVDPVKAAELFTTMDTPDMWNQKVLMEDFRAFGARTLFPNLWAKSGPSSLPTIKKIADWIGSTGEYPYAAMIGIVEKVAQKDTPTAEALVSDAINSSRKRRGFVNEHREFTNFILGIQKVVRPALLREAIEVELSALDSEANNDNSAQYLIQATDSEHTVQFTQQAEYVAYRLLPLIQQIDPSWADQVKEKYSVLKNLPAAPQTGPVQLTSAVVPPGETASKSQIVSTLDEHRLLQVTMFAESDPKQAAEIAKSIQDPARRAVAVATLAPFYSKIDQKQAADWFKESNSELEQLPPGPMKLKLMIAIAGYSLASDSKRAMSLFEKAFDLGEELFQEDMKANPGKMAYEGEGEEDLATATETFAKHPKARMSAISRVKAIRDDVLKAKLLVAAAKGVATPNQAA